MLAAAIAALAGSETATADGGWQVSPSVTGSSASALAVSSPSAGLAFVAMVTNGDALLTSVASHGQPTTIARTQLPDIKLTYQYASASVDPAGDAVIAWAAWTNGQHSGTVRAVYHLAGQSTWSAPEDITPKQVATSGVAEMAPATMVTPSGRLVVAASTSTSMVISVLGADGVWASRAVSAPYTLKPTIALDASGTTIAVGGRDRASTAFVTTLQLDATTGAPAPEGSYLALDQHAARLGSDFGIEPQPAGFVAMWERSADARSAQFVADDITLAPQLSAGPVHVVGSIAIPARFASAGAYVQQTALDAAGNVYLEMASPDGGAGRARTRVAVRHDGTWTTRTLPASYGSFLKRYGMAPSLGAPLPGSGVIIDFASGFLFDDLATSPNDPRSVVPTCVRHAASPPAVCRSRLEAGALTASGAVSGLAPVLDTPALPRGFVLSPVASATSPDGGRVIAIYGSGVAATGRSSGSTRKAELVIAFHA